MSAIAQRMNEQRSQRFILASDDVAESIIGVNGAVATGGRRTIQIQFWYGKELNAEGAEVFAKVRRGKTFAPSAKTSAPCALTLGSCETQPSLLHISPRLALFIVQRDFRDL